MFDGLLRGVTGESGRRSSQVWREMVLWVVGTALMVALSGSIRKHELSKAWVVTHMSRGERPEASNWTLRRRSSGLCAIGKVVICPAHEANDFLNAPTRVVAYDSNSGQQLWSSKPMSGIVIALAIQDEYIIAVLHHGTILCLDSNGDIRWESSVLRINYTLDNITQITTRAAVEFDDIGDSSKVLIAISRPTRVTRLSLALGDVLWSSSRESVYVNDNPAKSNDEYVRHPLPIDPRMIGPLPRAENAWEADARFWGSTAYDQDSVLLGTETSTHWTELRALHNYVSPPHADDIAIVSADEALIRLRTRNGLEIWRNGTWIHLGVPPAALIADLDHDLAIDTVAIVDTSTSPPKLSTVKSEYSPPCIAVSTRGSPPTERFLEMALCRDNSIEKEVELRRRAERRGHGRSVYSAPSLALVPTQKTKKLPPLTVFLSRLFGDLVEIESSRDYQHLDLLFAISRGVVTRISASGSLLWQNRQTPTWSLPTGGYTFLLRSLLLVQGQTKVALLETDSGAIVTSINLPLLWDDELTLVPPVVGTSVDKKGSDLILITTQFQIIALRLASKKMGQTVFRILILLAALALPFLARALAFDEDVVDERDNENEDVSSAPTGETIGGLSSSSGSAAVRRRLRH
mmetsp:Transcript_2237/g.3525  ORF Transcript_2237/g.3525 Transcript_2237/m.3525 type:complete len:634 (-) Transcript_2237:1839-3740(-)